MLTENEMKILYKILRRLKNKNAKSVLHKAIRIIEQLIQDNTSKHGNSGGIEKELKQLTDELTVNELRLLDKLLENKRDELIMLDEDDEEFEKIQDKIRRVYRDILLQEAFKNKNEELKNSNQKLKEELCCNDKIEQKKAVEVGF